MKVEIQVLLAKKYFMFWLFVFASTIVCAQEYDFQKMIERVVNTNRQISLTDTAIMDAWVASQNTDGSWNSLQYGKIAITSQETNNHVHRLWHLALACTSTGHAKYNDSTYKKAVKTGLQYWYNSKSVDANWWFNKIYFPQRLGEILMLFRIFDGYIPKTSSSAIDETKIISLFIPTQLNDITSHSTGANAVDIALHYVYRGLLTENGQLLEDTKNKLESVLADNIKPDMVYQDHGPQVMIASYGPVFCEGLIRLASYLANSPAAFNTESENFSKVLQFIRETQISSLRGKSWDFSTLGRSISREDAMYIPISYLREIADFLDPNNASVYSDALGRQEGIYPANYNIREFNKHYWKSDYTQHARSGYLFTVRNTSTRTVECETGNGENLKGNNLSYGATFIAVDGNEYTNIMPLWDWAMIPGTTFPYKSKLPERRTWGVNYGNTEFTGGVSDGNYGATVLQLDQTQLTAKKSWFFFDKEIVCLGSNITDNSTAEVRTTINQAWATTPLYACSKDYHTETQIKLGSGVYKSKNLKYLRHGKFGYYFPNTNNVNYTLQQKEGNWKTINNNQSPANIKGNVFTAWISHGTNPTKASYSYIIVPNVKNEKQAQDYNPDVVTIIENSSAVQAVYHKPLNVLQAIFHQSGSILFNGLEISVNRPCALMLKQETILTISNPSQSYTNVLVTLKTAHKSYSKAVDLPHETGFKGASVTVNLKENNN